MKKWIHTEANKAHCDEIWIHTEANKAHCGGPNYISYFKRSFFISKLAVLTEILYLCL